MSLKGSNKQKTTQNNSLDPQSLALFNQGYQPALDILGHTGVQNYTGPLGTGLDAQQTQAAGMAQANAGVGQGALNQAIGGAQAAGGYHPLDVTAGQVKGQDLSGYMNPYLDQVAGRALNQFDTMRQRSLVGNEEAAGPGAWGGSRHGVADSLTNENYATQAQDFLSNLYSGGYDRATGLAQGDIASNLQAQGMNQNAGLQGANLGLSAANSLANFGGQQNAMGAADANLINQYGQQAQATQQNANQMSYDEWLRQQQYPFLQAGAYGSLANAAPIVTDSKGTTTQSSSPGLLGYLSANANLAAQALSDVRRKKNIDFSHADSAGRKWYDFNYDFEADGTARHRGVMAHEVMITDPLAVSVRPDGYLQVDYGALQ